MRKKKYILFDRDGTLNKEVCYLSNPDDVELYSQVVPALLMLQNAGYGIIVVTNQSGIGRGYYSEDAMHSVNKRVADLLEEDGVIVEKFYYCPHMPADECECRKPLSGMVDQAVADYGIKLSEVVVVGDKICDVELGQRVGGKGVFVRTGHGNEVDLSKESVVPDYVCDNLFEAAQWIVQS